MDTRSRLSHLWVSLCVAVLLSLHLLPCGRIYQAVFFIILFIMAPSHQQQPSQHLASNHGANSSLSKCSLRGERKKKNKLKKALEKDDDSVGKELVTADPESQGVQQSLSQPPSTLVKLASSQTKHGKEYWYTRLPQPQALWITEVQKLNRGVHPHPLTLKPAEAPYECSGCKELGFGPSYRCQTDSCNYVLHKDCANVVADNSIVIHPFFKESNFVFYKEKPKGWRGRYCDACGNDVLGFFYHCRITKKDLHPCCFKLKHSISDIEGHVTFKLYKTTPKRCKRCKSKKVENDIKGWSYIYKDHCYHVSCVKAMIIDKWKEGYFCMQNMSLYDPQTRIPLTQKDMMMTKGSKGSGSKMKVIKLAAVALRLVVSVIFGDPSPLILGAVGALSGS